MVVSEKCCNFALAFENDTTAEAERGAKERLKSRAVSKKNKNFSRKIWWFEKFALTLQNISALKIVECIFERSGIENIEIITIDEVVQEKGPLLHKKRRNESLCQFRPSFEIER